MVSLLTVVLSVAAGLGFRRSFTGSAVMFYIAIASLMMPGLFVGLGINVLFNELGWETDWTTSGLGAQLTWTLPFGLLIMFAVLGRFNRAYEEAAKRPRRDRLAAHARSHVADSIAGHHRRRAVRLHPVLR